MKTFKQKSSGRKSDNRKNKSGDRKRPGGGPRTIDDVYEYHAPSNVRRANVGRRLALDRHELQGGRRGRRSGGSDSDGGQMDLDVDVAGLSQDAVEKLRAKLMRSADGVEDGDSVDGDGAVDSEDDEDIDSEDAFEESDRDAFAGSDFVRKGDARRHADYLRGKRQRRRHASVAKEVDLNEDSDAHRTEDDSDFRSASKNQEDGEDEDEKGTGEFFDILDVFDGRADPEDDDKKLQDGRRKKAEAMEEDGKEWGGMKDVDVDMTGDDESEGADEMDGDKEEEEEEEEDSADEEDDELHISASDAEDPSPEALADLESFLSNLDPAVPTNKRKKLVERSGAEANPAKRRRIADRTEAGEENEFGVQGSDALNIDDLLAPLAESSSNSLAALKRSTKLLTSSSSKTKTLLAPLPLRAQERLDREAAYEQTKEEVDKWTATMKRIKEAEHLSFPLQAEKPSRVSNLELAAKFTPSNELESAVDKLLKSAQLRDEDIEHTEALKMAHLTMEEVAARRAELRAMRELAFRADRKAKRIAKIKSKTYRRIRKKQRERLDGADGAGDADAGGDEDEEYAEERLKSEVQRAKERATLRHKNTGKWARAMKGREGLDQDQRQAIGEMLERGERLRRRIHGEDSGDEASKSEDEDEEDEERDEEAIRRGAFEELAALRAEGDGGAELLPTDLKSKSVFNMKFMRDAAARRAREADEMAEELQKDMGFGIDAQADEDESHGHGADAHNDGTEAPPPPKDATMVQRVGGRLSFRPGTMPPGLLQKPLGSLASDASSVTLQSADVLIPELTPTSSPSTPTPTSTAAPTLTPTLASTSALAPPSAPAPTPNPWLVPTASSSGPSRKRNEVRVHKGADALTKSTNKLQKQAGKRQEEKERARDDAVLEIDANNVLTIPDVPPAAAAASSLSGKECKEKARQEDEGASVPSPGLTSMHNGGRDDDESDVPSEVEAQERSAAEKKGKKSGKGVQAFQQRDLVALAFAGDNVVQAFEEAKRKETEADAPREVDTSLPGWGAWGGSGTKKPPPKPHLIKSVPGIVPTARADHAKAHVIISERRDKKAAKYLVRGGLPFPYTSHAQFERRMETPLGTEWNTRIGFQRATVPRVAKKMGKVIDPLEKLF